MAPDTHEVDLAVQAALGRFHAGRISEADARRQIVALLACTAIPAEVARGALGVDLQLRCDLGRKLADSVDTQGGLVGFRWDLGDGTRLEGVTAQHSYASGGTYQVALTVTSRSGATATMSQPVSVEAADLARLSDDEVAELAAPLATWGLRGWANRNLPVRLRPSMRERAYRIRSATETKRRRFRSARVNDTIDRTQDYCGFVVVQSEKGGVGKSPSRH